MVQKKIGGCNFPLAFYLIMPILIGIWGRDRPDPETVRTDEMTFAIYELEMGATALKMIAGDFSDLESAKDALVEQMEAKGFEIVEIEKDPDGHEAYDVLVCGRMIRQFAIQAQS